MADLNSTAPHNVQEKQKELERSIDIEHTIASRRRDSSVERPPTPITAPKLRKIAQGLDMNDQSTKTDEWEFIDRPNTMISPPSCEEDLIPLLTRHRTRSRQYCPSDSQSSLASHGIAPSICITDPVNPLTDFEIVSPRHSLASWDEDARGPPSAVSVDGSVLGKLDKRLEKIGKLGKKTVDDVKSMWKGLRSGAGSFLWRSGRGRKLKKRVAFAVQQKSKSSTN